jgi:hypothetical protein
LKLERPLSATELPSSVRVPLAGLLGWLVPGLGHIFLGHRTRGLILLVTITATFWFGIALGGLAGTVDRHGRTAWFLAELCNGGNTLTALAVRSVVVPTGPHATVRPGHWLTVDIGIHYAGISGLLNLLVILDVLVRADPQMTRVLADASGGSRAGQP